MNTPFDNPFDNPRSIILSSQEHFDSSLTDQGVAKLKNIILKEPLKLGLYSYLTDLNRLLYASSEEQSCFVIGDDLLKYNSMASNLPRIGILGVTMIDNIYYLVAEFYGNKSGNRQDAVDYLNSRLNEKF